MFSLHLMKQSGIARRLLLWFLILALLPMIILAILAYNRSKDDLMEAERDKVLAVAEYSTNRLERWARERRRSVTNLARLTASTGAMESFTRAFRPAADPGEFENSEEYQEAKAEQAVLIKHLDFIASQYAYQNLYLISMDGDVVASIKPHAVRGKNLKDFAYRETELARAFEKVRGESWPRRSEKGWIEAELTDFRPFPDTTGRAAFIVSPVRDCVDNRECGEPTGVLAVQMPQAAINEAALYNIGMSDKKGAGGLGKSGEVLVVSLEDDKIRLVAGARLKPEEAFQRSIPLGDQTKMVAFQQAIKTKLPGGGDMIDHNGEDTVAAWRFLDSLPWGVVVMMGKAEAAGPAKAQLNDLLWLGSVMILVVVGLALFVARSIYGPIGRLTRAVRALPSGDFRRRRVPVEGDGEFGELSRALNNAMDEVWLLQYVSNAANEAQGVEPALRATLEEVCRHAGMLVGHVYETDHDGGELVSSSIWHLPDPNLFPNFRRVTEDLRLPPGVGLPGRVLQSGQPEWVEDVRKKDGNYLPALAADDIEVRGGFAFPILVGKEVTAVLEFFTDRPAAPNPSLLRTMKTVGTLLGRAIERKREDKLLKEKAAAEAANQAKSAFLASVSHDLRTPLNAILGYSEMHYEDVPEGAEQAAAPGGRGSLDDAETRGQWEEEKRRIISDLRKINYKGKELLQIIKNVLDLSRIEAGKMPIDRETFDVAAVVREVLADERPGKDKGNRFELDCPDDVGTMHADKMLVKRILSNLLGNADRFTKQGVIRLSVERVAEGESEWVIFRVSDNGIGITPEQQGRIFESFTQAEKSIKSRYGGTGLGLTISKNFCQLMGGEISVESEPGRGTTFTVRLPAGVYAPRQEDVVNTADLTAAPEGATVVLVIDDDPAMRELTKHFLGKEGFHVEAAASGEDGIRLARKLRPDIITLDVVMPGMDGYGVFSALKADEELRDIPVVMLTIVDEKSHRFPHGVAEYMTKPIDWERLTAMLNKYRRPSESVCTVLVIEDREEDRELLRRTLVNDGWEVETAENGLVGLERVERRAPDLILLDLRMPEMDGFEFVKALRRDPRWARIPVAIITAQEITIEDRIRLSGCVEKFLEKGAYSREQLLREVRDLVSACAARRPVAETTRRL